MKKLLAASILLSLCGTAHAFPLYGTVRISTGTNTTPPLQTGAFNTSSGTVTNLQTTTLKFNDASTMIAAPYASTNTWSATQTFSTAVNMGAAGKAVAISSNTITPGATFYQNGTIGLSNGIGTSGQVVQSNGGSATTWVTPTTASPGGSTGAVQYNNAGALGGVTGSTTGQALIAQGSGIAPIFGYLPGSIITISSTSSTSNVTSTANTYTQLLSSTMTVKQSTSLIEITERVNLRCTNAGSGNCIVDIQLLCGSGAGTAVATIPDYMDTNLPTDFITATQTMEDLYAPGSSGTLNCRLYMKNQAANGTASFNPAGSGANLSNIVMKEIAQ